MARGGGSAVAGTTDIDRRAEAPDPRDVRHGLLVDVALVLLTHVAAGENLVDQLA